MMAKSKTSTPASAPGIVTKTVRTIRRRLIRQWVQTHPPVTESTPVALLSWLPSPPPSASRIEQWIAFHRAAGVSRFFVVLPDNDQVAALPSSENLVPIVSPLPITSTLDLIPHCANPALAGHPGWLALVSLDGHLFPPSTQSISTVLAQLPPLPVRQIPAETRGWNGRWLDPDVPVTRELVTVLDGVQTPPALIVSPQKPALRTNERGRLFSRLSTGTWCPMDASLCDEPAAPASASPVLRYSQYPYLAVEAARDARIAGRKSPSGSLREARALITPGRLDFSVQDRTVTPRSPALSSAKPASAAPREFAVLGLRRSGNHAVLQWLMSGLGPDRVFLNNVALGRNPFDGFLGHDAGPYEEGDLPLFAVPENRHWFTGRVAYSFEDYGTRDTGAWLRETGPLLPGTNRISILILRDPYNFFASRIRVEENHSLICTSLDPRHLPLLRDQWIEHAEEFTGRTRHLPDLVTIDYVRFVGDAAYRADLASRLGIVPDDAILSRVPDFGAGSSFDGLRHDGDARSMALLDRWRHYADHPLFRALMADPRIETLAREIYGELFDHRTITGLTS
jgi:hypothetical protein